MMDDDALIKMNGTISCKDTCRLCEKEFGWYAPIQKEFKPIDGLVEAEAIIRNGLMISGNNRFAEFDIYVICPSCGIKNQYNNVKLKIR